MNKKTWILILVCLTTVTVRAQVNSTFQSRFDIFMENAQNKYKNFREKANSEFADFMRKAWTREEVQPAKPLPKRPEPPKPVVRKPLQVPKYNLIPLGDVVVPKEPIVKKPEPIIPLQELEELDEEGKPEAETKPKEEVNPVVEAKPKEEAKPIVTPKVTEPEGLTFKWCGLTWNVPLEKEHRFDLKSVNEADVAGAWKVLSAAKYGPVVAACLKIRDSYQLPDWGYLRFLEAMANAFLPGKTNEARLLEMFILSQSGYQARIARSNGQLYLLVPSSGEIYEYSYLTLGGRSYFVVNKTPGRGSFYVFDRDFPRAQPFTWQMNKLPLLAGDGQARTLRGKRFPEVQTEVQVNKNLIAFMNDYPRCSDWNSYALASLSDQAKEGLYPALRQAINGKSKKTTVDMLLDFVQTAFDYKTDEQQFGKERPLFGDETLFYPYCDCEDRSILFSILVRELVGLDVVLLNYPQHLATAVCFGEQVEGDYFVLDGKRYVVCDPTFIGSHVGEAMPNYKNTKATIIKL